MYRICLSAILLISSVLTFAQVKLPSYEKGLSFANDDGSVLVKMNFRSQNLFTYSNDFDGSDEDMRAMVRRMRLKFGGHFFNPDYEYKLELGFSNRDIGNARDESQVNNAAKVVLDAVLKYHVDKHHTIWFGQTKLPGNRERVISSQALQFVDRSLVNSNFNIDRDFGVQWHSKFNLREMPVHAAFALSTGEGRNITTSNIGGLCYTGRVEVYPLGKFSSKGDYFGSDLEREPKPKLAIGGTYSLNEQTGRSRGQLGNFITNDYGYVKSDITATFIDLMFKYQGFSIMSEYGSRTLPTNVVGFTRGEGYVAQAGYLFKNNYEIAARYCSVNSGTDVDLNSLSEYTLCISRYIVKHKLKWQTDFAIFDNNSYRYRFQIEFGL